MFGYLKAYTDKLNTEEQAVYEGYYCGLCRELGKRFGTLARMILAYDPVYLALLNSGLYEEEEAFREGLCLLKKGVKTKIMESPSLLYAADMNLMLAYHNFRDRVLDSGDRKARTAVRLLEKPYRETADRYPRQEKALLRYMDSLQAFEHAPSDNPDYAANLTGEMLSEVFLFREDEFSRYVRPHLFYLGKYIYLIDAFEDVEKDLISGSYNPYSGLFGSPDFTARIRAHLESVIGESARCFEQIPLIRHAGILRNILYSGVWEAFARVEKKRREEAGGKQQE